jgi:hypothetical protein
VTVVLSLLFALTACVVSAFAPPKFGSDVAASAIVAAIVGWVALIATLAAASLVMLRGWP